MGSSREQERGTKIWDIREDHRARYKWARQVLTNRFSMVKQEGAEVLDIFCGNGYGSKILGDGPGGVRVRGVDRDEAAILEGKVHFAHPKVELQVLAVDPKVPATWPAAPRSGFDAVVCFESLEHVEHPAAFLDMLLDLVAVDGCLLVSVPNETVIPFSKEEWPWHFQHYTATELFDELERAGFDPCMWGQTGNRVMFTGPFGDGVEHHHVAYCEVAR